VKKLSRPKSKQKYFNSICVYNCFKELEYPRSVCSIKKKEKTPNLLELMMVKEEIIHYL